MITLNYYNHVTGGFLPVKVNPLFIKDVYETGHLTRVIFGDDSSFMVGDNTSQIRSLMQVPSL